MPIDPEWLRKHAKGGGAADVIDEDRACVCGYQLRGLRVGQPCPECGRRLGSDTRSGSRKVFALATYPNHVLSRLSLGATLAAYGCLMMGCVYAFLFIHRGVNLVADLPTVVPVMMHLFAALPGSVMWFVGLVLISGRDPEYHGDVATPANLLARVNRNHSLGLRAAILLGQVCWVLCEVCQTVGIWIEDSGSAWDFRLQLAGYGFAAIGCASLTPVCIMLRELAYHGRDDSAANRFMGLAFGLPVAGVVITVLPILPSLLGFSRTATYLFILVFVGMLAIAPVLLVQAVWSVGATARWARRNAESAAERDERFVRRTRGR